MTERPPGSLPPDETPPPEGPSPSDPEAPAAPPQPEAVPPPLPSPPPKPRVSPAGYTTALVRSLLAFVIMLLLGEVVAFIAAADSGLSSSEIVRIGGMVFFSFHHVGIEASVSNLDIGSLLGGLGAAGGIPGGAEGLDVPGGIDVTISLALSILALSAVAAWLLYRGGRAAAEAGGGTPAARVLLGAAIGVPYAVLALAVSFAVQFRPDLGPLGELRVGVAALPALLWPLAFGGVFGAVGGLAAGRAEGEGDAGALRWAAVVSGAARMLRWGLLLSLAGLLVLAAANPDVTREYFSGLAAAGPWDAFRIVFFTAILAAPLLAVNGFLGGMFAPVVVGEYLSTSSMTLISLLQFPRGGPGLEGLDPLSPTPPSGGLPFETGIARPEYFVFVLVALIAVVLGGRHAARRGQTRGAGAGAALGAAAGALFALAALFLAVLGGLGFKAQVDFGLQTNVTGHVGAHLIYTALLALVWGVGGGAIGGAMGATREREEPGIAPGPSEGTSWS